ncbi:carbamoyl phosphate synthase small subunit [Salisediminibacterium halotolerans]|uniref:Carbamoyl phosphate synthase small chain n=1 Tax=Salisediminibacterium halotolerans TaxID=517425 RepID=A0A1H9RPS3_9BACI|nr:carbamoyl phosphate synthase small subunit [Salisediminibacterium haloalkalitolerans]SER74485.1 carbamoyl-phosphate synthase small subunit [Salisediminibacterium haloalkalitolerans]
MTMGYLVLETGDVFTGNWIGADTDISGELVFNTSMTGYQEMVTDPSYTGQILTFTYPLIGNYGWQKNDAESNQIQASAVIMNELCKEPNHAGAKSTFEDELIRQGIPGLEGVDTREIVMQIRRHGTVTAVLTKNPELVKPESLKKPPKDGRYVKQAAEVDHTSYDSADGPHIVLLDFGHKHSILNALLQQDAAVTVVPFDTPANEIHRLAPDGIVLSNGPGDPMELTPIFSDIKELSLTYPTLGICLGHQVTALAHGAKTKKMKFGHRGGNHPVKDIETGKVWMTSQNHGYEVEFNSINSDDFFFFLKNVNDGTVEGFKHKHLPMIGVQFHPEAHPGPNDTAYIFNQFIDTVNMGGHSLWESMEA